MSNRVDFELYKKKCVELARVAGFDAHDWEALPVEVRHLFLIIDDYKAVVRPLVLRDKEKGASLAALSFKYGISIRAVRTILRNRKR
jgi:hypothetical protein